MEINENQEKERPPKANTRAILRETGAPASVFVFLSGVFIAGVYLSMPDILPLAALVSFPLLLASTNFSGLTCFALIGSLFLLAIGVSGLPLWRAVILFSTFALPSLVLLFYKSYPARVGKMITFFFEESSKLDSTQGVCALAVRALRGKGFFRHIALLLWNKETDTFKIVAATNAYEIGTEVPSDATFYISCHTSLKLESFSDPYSTAHFLPSKFKARSALCAPLHLGGRRFGVLVTESHSMRPRSMASRQVLYFFAVVLSYVIAEFDRRDAARRVPTVSKKGSFPAGKNN